MALVGSFKLQSRSYFSTHYLLGAERLASMAKDIEVLRGDEEALKNHKGFVVSSIMLSTAFMEAAINEVYQDASDNHKSYITTLPTDALLALAAFWYEAGEEQDKSGAGILQKYQVALALCRKAPFDRGAQPFQDAQLLIRLRNYLSHYKPEWIGTNEIHRLGQQLEAKQFQANRLMDGMANPYFPDKCLGYGCAQWSIDVGKKFVSEFFVRVGIDPKFK